MNPAADPIRAATSVDPSAVYAAFASNEGLVWSDAHRMWIAAHPEVVREVLDDPSCHVRPRDVPVPPSLVGSSAGAIFASLVRMTEGAYHARSKRAIDRAFEMVAPDLVRSEAAWATTMLLDEASGSRFAFDVSAYTLGQLFGVPEDRLPELRTWTSDFVRCLVPTATGEDIAAGTRAAGRLWSLMSGLFAGSEAEPLIGALERAFEDAGLPEPDAVIANMIGFLVQAHDAVAGLIGNTVVHLTRNPAALDAPLATVVAEVAHNDPSIQNTRRFVARDTVVAGQAVRAGDTILVVLAAGAERHTASCPFGHGPHACPGQAIAMIIAEEAVGELVRRGAVPVVLPDSVVYRPLANARIPDIEYAAPREESE